MRRVKKPARFVCTITFVNAVIVSTTCLSGGTPVISQQFGQRSGRLVDG